MGIGREILKEAKSIKEVSATYANEHKGDIGKPGQVFASFQAIADTREQVYHNIVDMCDSLDELKEYTSKALQDLIDFIDNTVYFIESADIIVYGVSEVTSSASYSYKKIGEWNIYSNGHYTDELEFAKEALSYE